MAKYHYLYALSLYAQKDNDEEEKTYCIHNAAVLAIIAPRRNDVEAAIRAQKQANSLVLEKFPVSEGYYGQDAQICFVDDEYKHL